MTNLEKWTAFHRPFPAPKRFVTMSWLWSINAALQRRVWMDSKYATTFPNMYVLFVGPPGSGKSVVVSNIRRMFEAIGVDANRHAGDVGGLFSAKSKPMFPLSANSTSFEAFVAFTAGCTAQHQYTDSDGKKKLYLHCSPAFILDEAASIFHKEAANMASFLLEGWTCVANYTRDTFKHGKHNIANMCVNLIAGIQPGKLKQLSSIDIIDNGFSRRCLMVYMGVTPKPVAFIKSIPESEEYLTDLYKHVRTLGKLYGEVTLTPAAEEWYVDLIEHRTGPPRNKSHYLTEYYTSRSQHLKKVAMAFHFSESTSMVMDIGPLKQADAYLSDLERDMHYAYVGGKDVRGEIIARIKGLLTLEPAGMKWEDLFPDIYDLCDKETFLTVLNDLVSAQQIEQQDDQTYILCQK